MARMQLNTDPLEVDTRKLRLAIGELIDEVLRSDEIAPALGEESGVSADDVRELASQRQEELLSEAGNPYDDYRRARWTVEHRHALARTGDLLPVLPDQMAAVIRSVPVVTRR